MFLIYGIKTLNFANLYESLSLARQKFLKSYQIINIIYLVYVNKTTLQHKNPLHKRYTKIVGARCVHAIYNTIIKPEGKRNDPDSDAEVVPTRQVLLVSHCSCCYGGFLLNENSIGVDLAQRMNERSRK